MPLTKSQLTQFIEREIPDFHRKRLENLAGLKLEKVLGRKNPYLFKAKHIENAGELVKQLLDAHLSSQEETVFGDFLEALAIHICQETYGGRKSTSEGIDLEFERDGRRHIVSIKSGPHWGNSQQIKRMRENFRQAKRIAKDPGLVAVNGCCYGRDNKHDKGDYLKLCGQSFWGLISGNDEMYQDIVEPLGLRAQERNDAFRKECEKVANRFTAEFIRTYCTEDGAIDWVKIVAFNSATIKPRNKKAKQAL